VRRIFAQISPNLPEKNSKETTAFHFISVAFFQGHFWKNQSTYSDFAKVFTHLAQISTDFARILSDFSRIFTNSKVWGMRLHP